MISKYSGTCWICNKPTKAGVDQYDLDSKKSYHAQCEDNQQPGPDAYRLADELKYRHYDWNELE